MLKEKKTLLWSGTFGPNSQVYRGGKKVNIYCNIASVFLFILRALNDCIYLVHSSIPTYQHSASISQCSEDIFYINKEKYERIKVDLV